MTEGTRKQPRLVLLCGLPASGKTTLARELADAYGAVRLNPDEWELALGIDPFDEEFQVKLEAEFSGLAQRLIALGTSVILEWGFWARSERDEKRELGRSLGAAVELRFLDVPYDELVRRVVDRHAAGGIAITESHMVGRHSVEGRAKQPRRVLELDHAALMYSWRSPPKRSRRSMAGTPSASSIGGMLSGTRSFRPRCGRRRL
jgi:predicted kinase